MRELFLQQCFRNKFFLIFLTCPLFFPGLTTAQEKAQVSRISPPLAGLLANQKEEGPVVLWVYTRASGKIPQHHLHLSDPVIVASGDYVRIWQVSLEKRSVSDYLANLPDAVFVEIPRKARPELSIGNLDLSVNGIRRAQERFTEIEGSGQVVSVKEERPDANDLDIRGRLSINSFSAALVNGHATLMSSIIAGAGNSWYSGRGVARRALISTVDFSRLIPEPLQYYINDSVKVQNHSYGVGIESYYGADAAAYDASAIDLPALLHVFSAGNSGDGQAGEGRFRGIPGFANLTGSFKMSKNTLAVGALDSMKQIESLSSRGPAHDGRVKPELVAFGEDGSSGAAALVSGTALLMQDLFRQTNSRIAPNALLRAILLNSAEDLGAKGPDYTYGFGSLNTWEALRTMSENRYDSGSLSAGASQRMLIQVPTGVSRLKITLSWNDPPATPNATAALVHDLDLRIRHTASGEVWLPWVLSLAPDPDSLKKDAVRGRDYVNNNEQISIDFPESGTYEVTINAQPFAGTQTFYVSWMLESEGQVTWLKPVRNDPVEAGAPYLLRWTTTGSAITGALEYKTLTGQNWTPIADPVSLSTGQFRWQVPVLSEPLVLRISTNGSEFYSDTIIVSNRLFPKVGYACADSFMVSWNSIPGIDVYNIYRMGDQYLQPYQTLSDTMVVLAASAFPNRILAVETRLQGRPGWRSPAFDYTTQGTACYFRTFQGVILGDEARLICELGSLFRVREIILEKRNGTTYQVLDRKQAGASLSFSFRDTSLLKGTNSYRIRLLRNNDSDVLSETEELFYTGSEGFRIYPSLLASGQPAYLVAEDLTDDAEILIYDVYGRVIQKDQLRESPQRLPTERLPAGIYLVGIFRKAERVFQSRLIVY